MTEAAIKKRFSRFPRQPVLTLVEMNEEGSSYKHRAVSNNEPIMYGGDTFVQSDIKVSPPPFGEELSTFKAEIDNSTRIPSSILLNASRRIEFRLMLLDTATLDEPSPTLLLDTMNMFVLGRRDMDRFNVKASIRPRALMSEPLPPQRVDSFLPGASWQ